MKKRYKLTVWKRNRRPNFSTKIKPMYRILGYEELGQFVVYMLELGYYVEVEYN